MLAAADQPVVVIEGRPPETHPIDYSAFLAKARSSEPISIERNDAIARIRAALKARSGRAWSVRGGRGSVWAWIYVSAPPSRCDADGSMSAEDAAELGRLFDLDRPVHDQGLMIQGQHDFRVEYVDRAEGNPPRRIGVALLD